MTKEEMQELVEKATKIAEKLLQNEPIRIALLVAIMLDSYFESNAKGDYELLKQEIRVARAKGFN